MKANLKLIKLLILLFLIITHNNLISFSQSYELWGIGRQNEGQLGNGYKPQVRKPILVDSNNVWKKIKIGLFHDVALTEDGKLFVQGSNFKNGLGLDLEENKNYGLTLFSNHLWKDFDVYIHYTAAIKSDGTLWLWGDFSKLELYNYKFNRFSQYGGDKDWNKVYCFNTFLLAQKNDGKVFVIGKLDENFIDDYEPNEYYRSSRYFEITELKDVIDIQTNYPNNTHLIALSKDSTLIGWGNAEGKKLILKEKLGYFLNLKEFSNDKWLSISTYDNVSFGIKKDSTLWAWGMIVNLDSNGRSIKLVKEFTQMDSLNKYNFINANFNFTLLLIDPNNKLFFKNANNYNLNNETESLFFNEKQDISYNQKWKYAVGKYLSYEFNSNTKMFSIDLNGKLYEWVDSSKYFQYWYQIKNNTFFSKLSKLNESRWKKIFCGNEYYFENEVLNYAINENNKLYAFGSNYTPYNLNDKKYFIVPEQVYDFTEWSYVSDGFYTKILIDKEGYMWGMGENSEGQLGNKNIYNEKIFLNNNIRFQTHLTKINEDNDWKSVKINYKISMAQKNDGTLWFTGNLGYLGSSNSLKYPNYGKFTKINEDNDWKDYYIGNEHILLLKNDGRIFGLGKNTFKQLGYEKDTTILEITHLHKNKLAKEIFINRSTNYTIGNDTKLYAWGDNLGEQIFVNNRYDSQYPIANYFNVSSSRNWKKFRANEYYRVAIKEDSTLWAWGYNYNNFMNTGNDYELFPVMIDSNHVWFDIETSGNQILLLRVPDDILNSVNNQVDKLNTSIFPNPSSEKISLNLGGVAVADLVVYDILGNEILSIPNYTSKSEIDISNLSMGTYTIQVQTSTGSISQRLIVNR